MTEIILAVIGVIGIIGAGAGKDIVQMFRSKKAGVTNPDAHAEAPEMKDPAPADPPRPSALEGWERLAEKVERRSDRLEARLDHVEEWNITQGDHIDVLENHIWLQLPPPPPPRPRYIPFKPEPSEEDQ